MSEYLDFAKEVAEESGKIMLQYFRSPERQTEIKDDRSPVTVADTKINNLVVEAIKKQFPGHGVLGEEESHVVDSDYIWVCDPIDGTLPYTHGLPISTFNLALTHKGQTITAVQLDPYMSRLYSAEKDGGAWLNGERIHVGEEFGGRIPINLEIYARTLFESGSVQIEAENALLGGDFALMRLISVGYSVGLVACGELGGAVFSGKTPYEAATCSLLITEAGGRFTNIFGATDSRYDQDINGIIAAAPGIHARITEALLPVVKAAKRREK